MAIINIKCSKCGLAMSIPEDCMDRLKKCEDIIVKKGDKTYIVCPMNKCENLTEIDIKGT